MHSRIEAYDIARALAIFGMVFVNFRLACESDTGSPLLLQIVSAMEGRASALFVVLAGIGISLMSQNARHSGNAQQKKAFRINILRRAFLLIIIGLAYTPIWPADILHFYGFYFITAIPLLFVSDRVLVITMLAVPVIFIALLSVFDYSTAWNFETLEYADFWSVAGMMRHIFFNGFHPVFPWLVFLLLGLIVGRQDLSVNSKRRKIMLFALLSWLGTELLSKKLLSLLHHQLSQEDLFALVGTNAMPPMPLYLLAAGSLALVIICLCIEWAQHQPDNVFVKCLASTGKMSLSLYIAHVILGMGLLEVFGLLPGASVEVAALAALLFCASAIIASQWWARRIGTGPLELIFKRLVGN